MQLAKATKSGIVQVLSTVNSLRMSWTTPPLYLDEFQQCVDQNGTALVILSTHQIGLTTHWTDGQGNPAFDRLHAMAEERGISVINQHDYIVRQGSRAKEAQ